MEMETELTPSPMADSPSSPNIFSVRIVSIDYYMAPPLPGVDVCYSSFHGEKVNEVPVIRVYGSTPAGQKTCLHLHRALPYLYVPCADIPIPLILEGDSYSLAVSLAVEKALKLRGNAAAKRQHVHGCSIVRARRLYGYHSSEELFVKIYIYNPHDIARAAKLLLAGSVFDISLQPHESHIPYLLQFMVDYNLYGMGHLHVNKMKFRNPIPSSFSSKVFNSSRKLSQESDNSAPEQADLINDSNTKIPIWVTSTIPGNWRWQILDECETPLHQTKDKVKRQSVCQLEGDAAVDDIVNKQFKTYASLSQACADVKMVQSLVPIWEEEAERTGMHEPAPPPDPGKPLAEHILKVFSLGLGLEHKLFYFCSEPENDFSLTPSEHLRSAASTPLSSDEFKLIDVADANLSYKFEESQHIKEIDRSGPPKEFFNEYRPMLTTGNSSCRESLSHGNGLSQFTGTVKQKAVDNEALSLLKWLATTQAAEEINSDDELAREIILSPLLPASTVDKVLEKANMDYESESQRECQDILDSVDEFNVRESHIEKVESDCPGPSSKKRIPQVDGSGDELYSFPCKELEESSSELEKNREHEKDSLERVLHLAGKADTGKQKMKSSSWGSLPFFTGTKKVDNFGTKNFCMDDGSSEGNKDQNAESSNLYAQVGEEYSRFHKKYASKHEESSVRDLMRRKRKRHVELCHSKGERERDVSSCPGSADFSKLLDNESGVMELMSCPDIGKKWNEFCGEERKVACGSGSTVQPSTMISENVGSSPILKHKLETVAEAESLELQQSEAFSVHQLKGHSELSSFKMQNPEASTEIHVTDGDGFNEPDIYSCTRGKALEIEFSCTGKYSEKGVQPMDACQDKALDVVPSLLEGGSPENEERPEKSLSDGEPYRDQEVVMGVPTHYLNDGSLLYLLTPAIAPPSVDAVNNWLCGNEGPSGSPVVGSQGSSCEDQDGSVPERDSPHDSMPDHKTLHHRKEGNAMPNSRNDDSALTNKLQSEECPKLKAIDNLSLDISQISGPDGKSGYTPLSQLGFRDPASVGAGQQLSIMSVEVQAESRGDLRSDPRFDAINVLTLACMADDDPLPVVYVLLHARSEFSPSSSRRSHDGLPDCKILLFQEEKQLFLHFIKVISKLDPDILVGWDVQGGSIGFLAERASYIGIGLLNLLSRTPTENKIFVGDAEHFDKGLVEDIPIGPMIADSGLIEEAVIEDEWGRTHASGVHVGGRIVLNLWRVMRGEVKLNLYTLEAVAEAVLRQKTPYIPPKILTKWFSSGYRHARYRCIEYLIKRTKLNLQIMNQLDLVNRTSELARVFGIDFFSVLSRGSQYRVESMLLRLAHTQNYVAISPGNEQVASQPAMECIPLVMEPESGFYGDPVVVLDFQSLYPSMIIAYNLCFCTSLGKVSPSRANTLGVSSYSPDLHFMRDYKDQIYLAPNGAMYVPPQVRKGILPRLLEEILSTRIMVKQAMKKLAPSQQVLYRILNARQLALKLIANVTYGYTAAGFSGRMPCAELADSIVQCGRRTLETAISHVNAHTNWNARVIYGDTDSMFVLLKGRSVKEAFQIGQEIASAISAMNPHPVTLKMEKVYQGCFLLTKKRYVGYSYESPDQVEPIFDAKGIETVRRDTCAAVAKAMEQTLRLYFEHQDISKVKVYLYRQWTRILSGRVSLQDFVFAKEVRLGTYSARTSSSLPPAAIVAMKAMRVDPRAEPPYGERVPYVVIHGEPGARLVDMVVDPLDLLALNSPFRLNGLYYITKQIIPALQRVFGLVGADLNQWFLEMPRPARENLGKRPFNAWNPQRTRIDYYYLSRHCMLCGELVPTSTHLCGKCSKKKDVVAAALTGKTSKLEKEMHHLAAICRHCGGGDWVLEAGVKCTSLACSVFYERCKVQKELQSISGVANEAGFYPKCFIEWF